MAGPASDAPLTDADINDFRAALQARRAEIDALESENRVAGAVVELDQQSVGRLSRMDAMERQAMAQATARRRVLERRMIAAALARIDDGEFGFCLGCGEPIPRARLALDPTTPRCVACVDA